MALLHEVGSLWKDVDEVTYSGWITLPYSLPAGTSLRAIAVPQPLRRSPKEKLRFNLEVPLIESRPDNWPNDLYFRGELMNQFFGPPRLPGDRYRVMLCGESGMGKSTAALGFPRCAYIDNHGSVTSYQAGYPEHVFFPCRPGQIVNADTTMEAIKILMQDPGDRLTVVIDDISTYNAQVDFKWNNRFFIRQEGTKGHHRDYYTNQPNDFIHTKREKNALVRRCLAMDLNVIFIARMKRLYAGTTGDKDFMKVIGSTYDGDQNLIYEIDFIFQLLQDESGRYAEIMGKQRVPYGCKPFPARLPFEITPEGRSTFFNSFSQYAVISMNQAHAVQDPVTDAIPQFAQIEHQPESPTPPGPTTPGGSEPQPEQSQVELEQPALETAAATAPQKTEGAPEITAAQLDEMVNLKNHYKIEKSEWEITLLKLYNVATAKALTQEQGKHFINYLKTERVPF